MAKRQLISIKSIKVLTYTPKTNTQEIENKIGRHIIYYVVHDVYKDEIEST